MGPRELSLQFMQNICSANRFYLSCPQNNSRILIKCQYIKSDIYTFIQIYIFSIYRDNNSRWSGMIGDNLGKRGGEGGEWRTMNSEFSNEIIDDHWSFQIVSAIISYLYKKGYKSPDVYKSQFLFTNVKTVKNF